MCVCVRVDRSGWEGEAALVVGSSSRAASWLQQASKLPPGGDRAETMAMGGGR